MKQQKKTKIEQTLLHSTVQRDGNQTSPWQEVIFPKNHSIANEETTYDAIIIGGGITGLTTALLLHRAHKKCIIIENRSLGFGTTGGTSAHLNTFFDATYPEIEQDFGKDAAKLVAQSGKKAISIIKEFIDNYGIDCDFEHKDALLFSENEKETKELEKILESSKNAGIAVDKAKGNKIPIPFEEVIQFKNQAQFHPLKYLAALAAEFLKAGGVIVEHQFVNKSEWRDGVHYAETQDLKIKGRNIVHATHTPEGINLFNFRCAAYRSYVIGFTLVGDAYPEELIYDMQEPYHYFRTHIINGKKHLLVGGEDHKTGQDSPEEAFSKLTDYVNSYFPIEEITYKWSSQYYIPTDGLPYIGHFPGKRDGSFVATGFNGNGMIFGSLSGHIISDAILEKENPFSSLYQPSRIKPIAGLKEFVKENTDAVWHLVADRFSIEKIDSLKEIKNNDGCLIEHDGKRLAVYKDNKGKIHALNPTCTHAGCIVNWNQEEKSWDCPCHGGRYNIRGEVITGPPTKNLQKLNIN
jgi:glycine/D-amino acid oxidase-like deaminating enzyme/nitrite reductase/ring-hydroxylating ferredoxin subunit